MPEIINKTGFIKYFGDIRIMPGNNDISLSDYESLKNHPRFPKYEEAIVVQLNNQPTEDVQPSVEPPSEHNDEYVDETLKDKLAKDMGIEEKEINYDKAIDPNHHTVTEFVEEYVTGETNLDVLESYLILEKEDKNRTTLINELKDMIEAVS